MKQTAEDLENTKVDLKQTKEDLEQSQIREEEAKHIVQRNALWNSLSL